MAGAPQHPLDLLVSIGLTQDAAGPALHDRFFAEEPDPDSLLRRVQAMRFDDALALATCERVELFAVSARPAAADGLLGVLAEEAGVQTAALRDHVRQRHGAPALAHLFAVAAGMESQVIGEPQILGQVKDCHRRAAALSLVGPGLEPMLQAAYQAAKRVRSESDIGRYTVSLGASATLVARDVHGDLGRCAALVIGLGEMGEFMAGELKTAGVRDMAILHEVPARAAAAAHRLACHYRPWEELPEALAGADIVVAAAGSGRFGVTLAQAEQALRARRRAPIYFIDAAVPRDIEPAVNDLDGAFVYDLEDLERIAVRGLASRESALSTACAIVADEVAGFVRQHAARGAVPSVVALRRHFEAVRAEILSGEGLDAEEATRRLVNRLLHDPTLALRAAAQDGAAGSQPMPELDEAMKHLFGLDGETEQSAPETGPPEDKST